MIDFKEMFTAPIVQSDGKIMDWWDENFIFSFAFWLSGKQSFVRDVRGCENDLLYSAKLYVARLLYELKNRKNIPKTSPTHYIESGCGWAATKI